MAWFRKARTRLQASDRRDLPADVWDKCPSCGEILFRQKLEENFYVCPECGYHNRLPAAEYLPLLLDDAEPEELFLELRSTDPLGFTDLKPYRQRLDQAEKEVGPSDALIAARGTLDGIEVRLGVMDFAFIGGSMGSVVGEKISRLGMDALEAKAPLILVSASGGARMMEGIFSLMQMAKTSVMLNQLHEEAIPYVSVLTDPTTGGVTASYAMLGDVNLAEPGSLIGFAGPRVIEQTIKQELPPGFQTAEFLLEHGMLDAIVDRRKLKQEIARLLRHMLNLSAPQEVEPEGTAAPEPVPV